MNPLTFRQRLENCNWKNNLTDGHPFLDPCNLEIMNDPRNMGKHTFDVETIRDWLATCKNQNKDFTNPLTNKKFTYKPEEDFDEQFPQNLALAGMIDLFVQSQEILKPAAPEKKPVDITPPEKPINIAPSKMPSSSSSPSEKPILPAPLHSSSNKFPNISNFDERFDAIKEKPSKEEKIPSASKEKNEAPSIAKEKSDDLPEQEEIKRNLISVDELVSWFKLMEKDGHPYIHFETPINSKDDVINLILMWVINLELQSKFKEPIFQFRVRDYETGVCTIINSNLAASIIKIDPSLLQKIKESNDTLVAVAAELVKPILAAMEQTTIAYKKLEGDNEGLYLSEILSLWVKRTQEKYDLSNPQDIKLVLFNSVLKNFDMKDIFEWDGITFFTAEKCTQLELSMRKEMIDSLLQACNQFVPQMQKLNLEQMILELDSTLTFRKIDSDISRTSIVLSYEEIWKICLIFSQPKALQLAEYLAQNTAQNKLKTNLPLIKSVMQDIFGSDNLLPELGLRHDDETKLKEKNYLIQAYLHELILKWKLFMGKPEEDGIRFNKMKLFQHILMCCNKLMSVDSSFQDFNSLLKKIPGLEGIAKDIELTAHFFKKTIAQDDFRRLSANEYLKKSGVINVFKREGFVTLISETNGNHQEAVRIAKTFLDSCEDDMQ